MRNWFDNWWPGVLTALMSAVMAWFARQISKLRNEIAASKALSLASSRDRITQKCVYHIKQGFLPMQERVDLVDMYDAYITMGGKKTLGDLVEQARALPNEKKE